MFSEVGRFKSLQHQTQDKRLISRISIGRGAMTLIGVIRKMALKALWNRCIIGRIFTEFGAFQLCLLHPPSLVWI